MADPLESSSDDHPPSSSSRVEFLFGRWRWDAPPWARALGRAVARGWRALTATRTRAITTLVAIVALAAGVYWYQTRPTPHYVTFVVADPPLTTYDDKGVQHIRPVTITFSESAAPLRALSAAVTSGIEISPAIAGVWTWASDMGLQFVPKDDWPIDTAFTVRFARRGLVSDQARLDKYSLTFHSQPFTTRVAQSQFYQDPRDPAMKKLVATVAFSHAVEAATFESRVSLAFAKDAAYLGLTPESRNFTVTYDKLRMEAYVHSAPLAMPRDDTTITLVVDKGVRGARGGNGSRDRLEAPVTIPGRTSLRFIDARMTAVDNARYEPEQMIVFGSSSPVDERAFNGKVSMFVLPERSARQAKEDRNPYPWTDDQVGEDVLAESKALTPTYVASDEAGNVTHAMKFLAPVGRYVYLLIKDGVQGTGGYLSGKPFTSTVKVEPYPRALTFLGQGALVPLGGDRKVGYLVRDVERVQVEVGRVLPNQLQHLASVMWDFAKPYVPNDVENSVVERAITIRNYGAVAPGKPTYDSIDLAKFLQEQSTARRGLFLLRVRSTGRQRPGTSGTSEADYAHDYQAIEDTRLILVTDLGFITKVAKDGSRDVYVQSIQTGRPVEGARVELLGANGLPLQAATTDATGRVRLAKPDDTMRRERAPHLLTVQREGDISFLPLRTSGRELEVSRFDTGGVENAKSAQQVSTYLFSDRGIYRPGESAHLGVIARTADWSSSLSGLPIDIEISDPRGQVVSKSQVALSAASFDELTFTSQPAAPTGTYEAVAYLTREDKRRELLGSTTFTVREFEPDRLKVQLDLSAATVPGWLTPADVKARLTVMHLFGEAASGRRVEGELNLTPVLPHFAKYPEYRFQVGESLKEPYHETLTATVTDDKGAAEFNLDLQRFVGRAYRLSVLARAYEAEGGRNVAAQNSAIVSDASFLVGVKSDGDLSYIRRGTARTATWLAVNQQLTSVPADSLSLEWVQRKYASVLTRQADGTFKYVSQLRETVRDTKPAKLAAAGTALPIPTDEPGDFVLVLRDAAGSELNRLSYSVAGQANLSRSLERDAELQIQLDKTFYHAGETIDVSIRAPYIGAGLLTVEREKVFAYQWFKTSTTASVQHITLPADFEGNGYVSVQFLRDPASDELFLSPLSYGIAAFDADLSSRKQTLTLTAPAQVKPGDALEIHVAPGEASRVVVFAVDEGILQVARYRNPDPLGYFFQKRRLEVDTKQILDLILPEFNRFVALSAAGGDADGGFARHLNPFNRKHKAPVAYWSGVIDVPATGADVEYVVPDYFNGRLRIVAVAASAKRVAVADASTEVKGDFILTPNVPPTASPGDEFLVTVGVFNNTTTGSDAVHVEAKPGAGLTILGSSQVDLQIAEKKEAVGEFRVRATSALGAASLTFSATRGAASAKMEESIGIRPTVAYRTQLTLGRFTGASANAPITRDLFEEKRTVEAAISTLPLAWSQGLSVYLSEYPYTCTEQILSQGFAALLIAARPEFGTVKTRPGGVQPLEWTFSMLRSRANDDGGLGLWSASPDTSEFASVYAAHFLVEARDHGQKIPAELLQSLDSWLNRFATTPASSLPDARLRAYAVYLLARQGIRPAAALSNVEQELTRRYAPAWQTDIAAAYIASTYRLLQRTDDADRIIKAVPWSAQAKGYDGADYYYGPAVHDAELLYLLARHFPTRLGATPPPALETIAKNVNVTSLSAATALLALDAYATTTSATATLGVSEIGKDKRERALTLPPSTIPKVAISASAASVQFSQKGAPAAYYVLAESGFDRQPPAPRSDGVEIIRDFVDAKGTILTKVIVGQEFFVRLRLRATTTAVPQIAVVDLLPSGVEPVLELQAQIASDSSKAGADPATLRARAGVARLPLGVSAQSDWRPSNIDVRDDRVILYGDATPGIGTFTYRVRASNIGIFQVPPAFAEGMYNRTIAGISAAGRLEVIKP